MKEADHPCKHEDEKLAILEMKVWIDPNAYIVYQHYEKPVASKQVLAAQSSQSTSSKRNVHVRDCRKLNVQYKMNCNLYPGDNPSLYIRETARNLFTRSKEHVANYTSRNRESFIWKHQVYHHYGAEATFSA